MKQRKYNFIFSNFNKPLSTKTFTNELVPLVHYNINLNFDCIESVDGFTNFFSTYFSAEEMSYLNDNFTNILSSIINFYPYEFYDIISKTYKTRLFFITLLYPPK